MDCNEAHLSGPLNQEVVAQRGGLVEDPVCGPWWLPHPVSRGGRVCGLPGEFCVAVEEA